MFKAWHKVIATPTAIASVGITAYLINLWQNPSPLLNSTLDKEPEIPEEDAIPPLPDPGMDTNKQEGNVDEEAQEQPQESNVNNQGNLGKNEDTTSKDEDTQVKNKDNSESESTQSSSRPQVLESPKAITNKGTKDEMINERAVEKEIKKLIDKIVREKYSWMSDAHTLKNTFEIHELMNIGNKLLQQITKVQKI